MAPTPSEELNAIVKDIVETVHPRKMIVAGAGAGKTTTFGKLLDALPSSATDRRLVMTFLGGLKRDLEKDLGDKARVQTFHGYCYTTLKQSASIREAAGFTADLRYFPRLISLAKADWVIAKGGAAPSYVPSLRKLVMNEEAEFLLARASYYDAVGHDDGTVHLHRVLAADPALVPAYDLVIVDEVQDLNGAEMAMIDMLSGGSNIVVAGDDDQALYGDLRDASEDHIRGLYGREDYLQKNLPFCMRCSPAVVDATNDIISEADKRGLLGKRIPKRYDPFPRPEVDAKYPAIKVVETTTQTPRANLFGKYVLDQIGKIPAEEIKESHEKGFPTVLIIGSKPWASQVQSYLEDSGLHVETKAPVEEQMDDPFVKADALSILAESPESSLGWRIAIEVDKPVGYEGWISAAIQTGDPLYALVDAGFRAAVLQEAQGWAPAEAEEVEPIVLDPAKPTIRLTTFEGAKGMSAQHVFILGLNHKSNIRAVDVRRMIVALTRARKQCCLLRAKMAFGKKGATFIKPSIFIGWIRPARKLTEQVTAASFKKAPAPTGT